MAPHSGITLRSPEGASVRSAHKVDVVNETWDQRTLLGVGRGGGFFSYYGGGGVEL